MLVPLADQDFVYSDLRLKCSNVRWDPHYQRSDCQEGFLLSNLDSLMLTNSEFMRTTDSGIPKHPKSCQNPLSFVFAQTLLVAFCNCRRPARHI